MYCTWKIFSNNTRQCTLYVTMKDTISAMKDQESPPLIVCVSVRAYTRMSLITYSTE